MSTTLRHRWQIGWLTGTRTCSACSLLPLDDDDTSSPCPDALDDVMELDHVIRVYDDGTMDEPRDIHAPELERLAVDDDGQILAGAEDSMLAALRAADWDAMTGYTGQYAYRGRFDDEGDFVWQELDGGGELDAVERVSPVIRRAIDFDSIWQEWESEGHWSAPATGGGVHIFRDI